jgi:hypothetical protein
MSKSHYIVIPDSKMRTISHPFGAICVPRGHFFIHAMLLLYIMFLFIPCFFFLVVGECFYYYPCMFDSNKMGHIQKDSWINQSINQSINLWNVNRKQNLNPCTCRKSRDHVLCFWKESFCNFMSLTDCSEQKGHPFHCFMDYYLICKFKISKSRVSF